MYHLEVYWEPQDESVTIDGHITIREEADLSAVMAEFADYVKRMISLDLENLCPTCKGTGLVQGEYESLTCPDCYGEGVSPSPNLEPLASW